MRLATINSPIVAFSPVLRPILLLLLTHLIAEGFSVEAAPKSIVIDHRPGTAGGQDDGFLEKNESSLNLGSDQEGHVRSINLQPFGPKSAINDLEEDEGDIYGVDAVSSVHDSPKTRQKNASIIERPPSPITPCSVPHSMRCEALGSSTCFCNNVAICSQGRGGFFWATGKLL